MRTRDMLVLMAMGLAVGLAEKTGSSRAFPVRPRRSNAASKRIDPSPATTFSADLLHRLLTPSILQNVATGGWGLSPLSETSETTEERAMGVMGLTLSFASFLVLVIVLSRIHRHMTTLFTHHISDILGRKPPPFALTRDKSLGHGNDVDVNVDVDATLRGYLQTKLPKVVEARGGGLSRANAGEGKEEFIRMFGGASSGGSAKVRVCFQGKRYPQRQRKTDELPGGAALSPSPSLPAITQSDSVFERRRPNISLPESTVTSQSKLDIDPSTLTDFEAFAILAGVFTSVGILTLPRAVEVTGWFSLIVWMIVFTCAGIGCYLLSAVKDIANAEEGSLSTGYIGTIIWALGKGPGLVLLAFLVVEHTGTAAVLMASTWETLYVLATSSDEFWTLLLVSLGIYVLLCIPRSLRYVAWTSFASFGCAVAMALVLSILVMGGDVPNTSSDKSPGEHTDKTLLGIGLALFASAIGVPATVTVRTNMRSSSHFGIILVSSLLFSGCIALVVAVCGRLRYQSLTQNLITLNLSAESSLLGPFAAALGCASSGFIAHTTISLFSVHIQAGFGVLFAKRKRGSSALHVRLLSLLLQLAVLVVFVFLASFLTAEIEVMSAGIGLLCVPVTAVGLPAIMFLKESWPYENGVWRCVPLSMLIVVTLLLTVCGGAAWRHAISYYLTNSN